MPSSPSTASTLSQAPETPLFENVETSPPSPKKLIILSLDRLERDIASYPELTRKARSSFSEIIQPPEDRRAFIQLERFALLLTPGTGCALVPAQTLVTNKNNIVLSGLLQYVRSGFSVVFCMTRSLSEHPELWTTVEDSFFELGIPWKIAGLDESSYVPGLAPQQPLDIPAGEDVHMKALALSGVSLEEAVLLHPAETSRGLAAALGFSQACPLAVAEQGDQHGFFCWVGNTEDDGLTAELVMKWLSKRHPSQAQDAEMATEEGGNTSKETTPCATPSAEIRRSARIQQRKEKLGDRYMKKTRDD